MRSGMRPLRRGPFSPISWMEMRRFGDAVAAYETEANETEAKTFQEAGAVT